MSETISELEARLAALPAGDEHVRERVDLLNAIGWKVREAADWDRVLANANEAMDLSQKHAYKAGLSGAFRNSAFAHYMLADYKAALAEALVSHRMAEELGQVWEQANALSVIALVHWSLGQYEQALEEGFRGVRLIEQTGDPWGTAWGYTIIGGIYQAIGDSQKALEYHQKSHQLFAGQDYGLGEARSLSGLGTAYQAVGDIDGALECHQKALVIYRQIKNQNGESRALNDIGEIYFEQQNYEKALQLHLASLKIRDEEKNRQAQTTSLLNLGRLYLKTGDLEAARDVLDRALRISREIGAKPKESKAHELLSRLHEQAGDFQSALSHHRCFHTLREEVFNEEESTKLRNLQTGIEVERSEREAEIQRLKTVELKEKNDELARLLAELQAAQAQLVHGEKMSALGDLVAALAHEINTPLGAIRSSADISMKAAERIVEAIEQSKTVAELKSRRPVQATVSALRKNGYLIATASDRISRLVRSLKSFARLDQAEFQRFHLNDSVCDSLAVLEPVLPGGVELVQELSEMAPIYGYPAELNQVVLNLIRNATEAISDNGTVTVRTFAENGFQVFQVADTGRGIPEEQIGRLFNLGFNVGEARVKASMSLFTSLNIVKKHNGEINVESAVGEGSTFTVRIRGLDPIDGERASSESEAGAILKLND